MAVLSAIKEPPGRASSEQNQLREERKRTGRYVAICTALFLLLLGIYQALVHGTPQYAALFAPAVIMFIYVLWILHTSRNQNARLRKLQLEISEATEVTDICENSSNEIERIDSSKHFNRSFSVP